jgi:hypothetical protein
VVLFGLALLSKESAIILLPLFWLAAPPEGNWRRSMTRMLPYVALSTLAIASIAAMRTYSFRFSDGSFSLDAPFWISWTRGFVRILWIWGWASGAAIVFVCKEPNLGRAALRALAWIGIALVPYSFLTYSTQIPSRQTYLASAGLCFLFGLAVAHLPARPVPATWANHQKIVSAVVVLMLLHNIGYLWTRKRAQFLEPDLE